MSPHQAFRRSNLTGPTLNMLQNKCPSQRHFTVHTLTACVTTAPNLRFGAGLSLTGDRCVVKLRIAVLAFSFGGRHLSARLGTLRDLGTGRPRPAPAKLRRSAYSFNECVKITNAQTL